MKRLLIVSSEFPPGPGGIGTHAFQLAQNLEKLGWEIIVVARQDYASHDEIVQFNKRQLFHIHRLAPAPTLLGELIYRWHVSGKLMRRFAPDIMLATGSRSLWLTAVLARQYQRVPWVAIAHGTELLPMSKIEQRLTRWAFEQSDRVVSVSQFTRKTMHNAKIRPRSDTVICNGADDNVFTVVQSSVLAEFRANLNFEYSRLIITVGNVTERKGQDVVIRALPKILEACPNTHYLIVGLPTNREQLSQLAQNLGVETFVHFLGRVESDELVKYLNLSDIFVMSSKQTVSGDFEGFGIAAIEAALCGKPAVVTRDSGLAEAIVDGNTGVLVPQNDPNATAQSVIKLLYNDDLRAQMGQRARTRALEEQTWSQIAVEYQHQLQDVLIANKR